jgi:hypothetical protein
MTLFSLFIYSINRELVFTVDCNRHPWLNFQRWFSFYSDSVFGDDLCISTGIVCLTIPCVKHESIFCYRFYASLVNSWTLSTPYVRCHSYFSCDFKVYSDSVFANDFWSVVTQFAMTIPCVNDDSVFSIDFIRQLWISIRCRFHPSPLT